MDVLVLCIDRDNDLGEKADILSPVTGRRNNLKAAISLASEDPEDSDINCIFSAIKLYDEEKEKGSDVEIITLCGDKSLDLKSDERIASQLDTIFKEKKPKKVYFVGDGAGDELVLPIIQSRVKVDHVERVVVKQHENIESTFYILKRALDDERIQRKIFLPLGLVAIVFSLFSIFGYSNYGIMAIILTIGIYWFLRAIQFKERVSELMEDMRIGFSSARATLYTSPIALLVITVGTIYAYTTTQNQWTTIVEALLIFGRTVIPWLVIGSLVRWTGTIIDAYYKDSKLPLSTANMMVSVIVLGFIIAGSIDLLQYVFGYREKATLLIPLIEITCGILIGIIGSIISRYIRYHMSSAKTWRHQIEEI